MSYAGDDFWAAYAEYVEECLPRHVNAARALLGRRRLSAFIDLGSGRCYTAYFLAKEMSRRRIARLTVDSDPGAHAELAVDYRKDLDKVIDLALNGRKAGGPTEFVSLFSSECTASAEDNQAMYEKLFSSLPTLKYGLVSGFYYRGRESQMTVGEAGGIISYQSTAPIAVSAVYAETRLIFDAPSKMFGPDVVEVWKLLVRK